ncbi:FAD-linked sulfhydryl oxidase ERV1 [Alnus glutinosa]|uniref:FAD-linked sulfhydryl oxidase ERV1 n=1 Tax=Alnus glutinosa TaxID=3517 RepID=UPI002D76901F|nr:FAD-linked sulfhydryl oxidase ERV1 [Alnus glutinosa]
MSENPLQALCQTFEKVSSSIQTHLSNLLGQPHHPSPTRKKPPLSLSSPSKVNPSSNDSAAPLQPNDILNKGKSASPVTKEELGRASWTFLHTLAAQYPDNPTRQQKKDVKELMAIFSRMYPCKECADHFKEVLRANPVQAGSHAEFSQWLCHVHNVVNRSLGKLIFPCERVDARWGKLECEQRACDLLGNMTEFGDETR